MSTDNSAPIADFDVTGAKPVPAYLLHSNTSSSFATFTYGSCTLVYIYILHHLSAANAAR